MIIITALLTFFAFLSCLPVGYYAAGKKKSELHSVILISFFTLITHVVIVVMTAGMVIQNTSLLILASLSGALSIGTLGILNHYLRDTYEFTRENLLSYASEISKDKLVMIVVGLFVFQQFFTIARISFAPPNVFDSQVYHLPISIEWLQTGDIELYDDVPVGRLNYATKMPKILNFWVLATSQDVHMIEFSQYFGYILLLFASYAVLRSLGTQRNWATIGSLLIGSIPIIVIENHTLQDHLLLTAMHISVIAFIMALIDKKLHYKVGFSLVGVALGMLLASKFSAPAHVISLGLVFGILFPMTVWKVIKEQTAFSVIMTGLTASIVGGVWYLGNIIYYGKPFGPSQAQSAQENIFLKNIIDFPMRFFDSAHRYTPDLINISGFGIHVITFGALASICALIVYWKNKKILALLGSSIMLLSMYFAVYFTPYNYRLFIFFPVILLIVGTFYISKTKSYHLRNLTSGLIIFGMLFTTGTTVYTDYIEEPLPVYRDLLELYPNDRTAVRFDYGSDKFRHDPSFLFIDQYIPESEKILYITQNEGFGLDDNILAAYYGHSLQRKVVWGGDIAYSTYFKPDGTPTEKLIPFMQSQKIKFVHNNSVFFYKPIDFKMEGTPFIRITPRLFYLP